MYHSANSSLSAYYTSAVSNTNANTNVAPPADGLHRDTNPRFSDTPNSILFSPLSDTLIAGHCDNATSSSSTTTTTTTCGAGGVVHDIDEQLFTRAPLAHTQDNTLTRHSTLVDTSSANGQQSSDAGTNASGANDTSIAEDAIGEDVPSTTSEINEICRRAIDSARKQSRPAVQPHSGEIRAQADQQEQDHQPEELVGQHAIDAICRRAIESVNQTKLDTVCQHDLDMASNNNSHNNSTTSSGSGGSGVSGREVNSVFKTPSAYVNTTSTSSRKTPALSTNASISPATTSRALQLLDLVANRNPVTTTATSSTTTTSTTSTGSNKLGEDIQRPDANKNRISPIARLDALLQNHRSTGRVGAATNDSRRSSSSSVSSADSSHVTRRRTRPPSHITLGISGVPSTSTSTSTSSVTTTSTTAKTPTSDNLSRRPLSTSAAAVDRIDCLLRRHAPSASSVKLAPPPRPASSALDYKWRRSQSQSSALEGRSHPATSREPSFEAGEFPGDKTNLEGNPLTTTRELSSPDGAETKTSALARNPPDQRKSPSRRVKIINRPRPQSEVNAVKAARTGNPSKERSKSPPLPSKWLAESESLGESSGSGCECNNADHHGNEHDDTLKCIHSSTTTTSTTISSTTAHSELDQPSCTTPPWSGEEDAEEEEAGRSSKVNSSKSPSSCSTSAIHSAATNSPSLPVQSWLRRLSAGSGATIPRTSSRSSSVAPTVGAVVTTPVSPASSSTRSASLRSRASVESAEEAKRRFYDSVSVALRLPSPAGDAANAVDPQPRELNAHPTPTQCQPDKQAQQVQTRCSSEDDDGDTFETPLPEKCNKPGLRSLPIVSSLSTNTSADQQSAKLRSHVSVDGQVVPCANSSSSSAVHLVLDTPTVTDTPTQNPAIRTPTTSKKRRSFISSLFGKRRAESTDSVLKAAASSSILPSGNNRLASASNIRATSSKSTSKSSSHLNDVSPAPPTSVAKKSTSASSTSVGQGDKKKSGKSLKEKSRSSSKLITLFNKLVKST